MLLPRYKPFRRNKTISEEARLTFNVHCIKHRLVNENMSHGIQEISSDTNISCRNISLIGIKLNRYSLDTPGAARRRV